MRCLTKMESSEIKTEIQLDLCLALHCARILRTNTRFSSCTLLSAADPCVCFCAHTTRDIGTENRARAPNDVVFKDRKPSWLVRIFDIGHQQKSQLHLLKIANNDCWAVASAYDRALCLNKNVAHDENNSLSKCDRC